MSEMKGNKFSFPVQYNTQTSSWSQNARQLLLFSSFPKQSTVFFSCSPSGCTVLRGHPLSLETILPLLFFTITKRLIIYVKRNLTASVITISYIIIYNQFICMKIELQLSHQCFFKIKFFLLKNNFFMCFW